MDADKSFIEVPADGHFPIRNLPYGVFSTVETPWPRVGVAIGDRILDLAVLERAGLLPINGQIFERSSLNAFMALGPEIWRETRARIGELLAAGTPQLRDDAALRARALVPMAEARMHLPVEIGGYTDFYSSKEHAANVGAMFRDPKHPLLPNWLHMPIGYNARASSVVISGTPIRRPLGQTKAPDAAEPAFGPCAKLDFELETAFIIGCGNDLGAPVPVDEAEAHIFGLVLMNDWSARDLQQWEYVPLGPFNGKSFGTTLSPWVVTLDALEPFRVEGPAQDPRPLPYLRRHGPQAFDIHLEAAIRPAGASAPTTVSATNFRHMYWSMAQQLAHHTVSGCNTRIGDLMGSGAISGEAADSFGSLLELTWNGANPLTLPDGSRRRFIEDGDEIALTGWCQGDGYRVGFGEAVGKILPALAGADGGE